MLTRHGIYIRECGNKIGSTSQYQRLAVCRPEQLDRPSDALVAELHVPQPVDVR